MEFDRLIEQLLGEQFAGEFGMEDTSMDPAVTLEIAKFLDPTGVLSWGDAYDAYQAFAKEQTPLNGLMLMLAIGSVVPVGKYYTAGAKAALKAGKVAEAAKLYKQAAPQIKKILYSDLATLQKYNIDPKIAQQALNISEQSIDDLAYQIVQRFPTQKIPHLGSFRGTILSRWKYKGLKTDIINTTKDIDYYTRQYVQGVNRVFAGRKFNPAELELLDYVVVKGPRQVAELRDKVSGTKFLMYSASGLGAPGKKAAGEWQTIPGMGDANAALWGEQGIIKDYFLKDDNTVRLTQGGNQYLTQLARYLEQNGITSLEY